MNDANGRPSRNSSVRMHFMLWRKDSLFLDWNRAYRIVVSCVYSPVCSLLRVLAVELHSFSFLFAMWVYGSSHTVSVSSHASLAYHIVLTLHLRPNLLYLFDFVFSCIFISALCIWDVVRVLFYFKRNRRYSSCRVSHKHKCDYIDYLSGCELRACTFGVRTART